MFISESKSVFEVLRIVRGLLLFGMFVVLSSACSTKVDTADATSAPGGAGPAVPVRTAFAAVKPMPVLIDAVGTAEAVSSVNVRSQVSGQLSEIHFAEGQEVPKGQLLFVLDPRPFQAALQQAEAVLARDTAQAKSADAQRARVDALFAQGLISQQDHDVQTAAAAAAEATIASDEAQVDQAKLALQYSRISAPMDGRTGALMVHPGDLVSVSDPNPLVTINQVSPIYISFSVPGRFLADIQRYRAKSALTVVARPQTSQPPGAQSLSPNAAESSPTTAGAASPAAPASTAEGTVAFIDNSVDPTTGGIKLKASFPNRDHSLWPGLFAQVSLQLSTEQRAIVVPAVSVQLSQQGQYVYVVKADHTVEMRPVTVERQQDDDAIIAHGLSAGEQVVTDGQLRLSPGARVAMQEAAKSS